MGIRCDPAIMKQVAVISRIMPIVRKVSTNEERAYLLCSVITAMEYEKRAMVTIMVPVISVLFIIV
jgi:hypothetical protein